MTRAANTQFSFADLEFLEKGVRLKPTLHAVSDFIVGHGHVIDELRRDLNRGLKNPHTGRRTGELHTAFRSPLHRSQSVEI